MTPPGHPDALAWARLLGRDLGPLAAWRLRRHLAGCAACQARHATLLEGRADFEGAPARAEQLRRLEARATAPAAPARGRGLVLAGALAAALAVGASLAVVGARDREAAPLEPKGGDQFTVYVLGPLGPAPLGPACAEGDRLTARFRTGHRHLLVLEHDGAGEVQELLRSADATAAPRLQPSWVLDARPGEECFAAFFSDAPLELATATAALKASPASPAVPGASVQVRCCLKGRGR